MQGGPINDLLHEVGSSEQLAKSIEHLLFECEGQFYKFKRFSRNDICTEQMKDDQGRQVSMADYYAKKYRRKLDMRGFVVETTKKDPTTKKELKFPAELCNLLRGQKPKAREYFEHIGHISNIGYIILIANMLISNVAI